MRIIGATLAALAVGLTLSAGQPATAAGANHAGAARQAGGGRMGKMAQQLNLTDAQKAQMKSILLDMRAKMQAIQADTSLSPQAKQAKLMTLRKGMMLQMAAILTPAQQAQLKQLRQQRKAK